MTMKKTPKVSKNAPTAPMVAANEGDDYLAELSVWRVSRVT
jgi:hypothetical protein